MKQKDYIEFIWLHIAIFKFFGYWKPNSNDKYLSNIIYTTFTTVSWVLSTICQTVYVTMATDDMNDFTDLLFKDISFMMDLINMSVIYRNQDKIGDFVFQLDTDSFLQPSSEKHLELSRALRSFHNLLFFLKALINFQVYIYFVVSTFLAEEKTMILPWWIPFDWEKTPYYEIVICIQNFLWLLICSLSVNSDMLVYGMLLQVGLQCDYLCDVFDSFETFHVQKGVLCVNSEENIRELKKDSRKFSQVMTENMIVCVKHHRKIHGLAKDIECIYRVTFFSLLLEASVIICSILFQLTQVTFEEEPTKYLMLISFFVGMLIQQLSYYWFCNEIIIKSGNIFTSAFKTPWVDCDMKFKKILLIFLTRTVNPIEIKCAGLFTLSTSIFVAVLRSSYSYFTVLQGIQERISNTNQS